ncbi:MAG TPA: X-Pro aminopeptidase [Holosporales bacterium]|nr:X-Pro aminopeptidase [Holosporales bacterium]
MLNKIQGYLQQRNIDALYIPKADRFQGEYIQPCDEKLHFVSGFSGSAGYALITKNMGILSADSRYTLQAEQEVDQDEWQIVNSADMRLEDLLTKHKIESMTVDPWLITVKQVSALKQHVAVLPFEEDPFKQWWHDRPSPSKEKAFLLDVIYSGVAAKDKITQITSMVQQPLLISLCEDVCWLLNIRGKDVPYTPVLHSMAILDVSGHVHVFLDLDKVTLEVADNFKGIATFYSEDTLVDFIKNIPVLRYDPAQTPYAMMINRTAHYDSAQENPITLLKAKKNKTEQDGMRNAHVKDGVAVINTLYWLDTHPQKEKLTELDVVDFILSERKKQALFQMPSFSTIAGSGPNGQSAHYKPAQKTNRCLKKEDTLLLLDSGGQYLDGTTDITRTIALDQLTDAQKMDYTLVLKGHIALSTCVFPKGTTGAHLDILARQFLWQHGKDYGHGTGHGVGHFLSVHEGPQRISKFGFNTPLEPGMVVSNEPGYYHGTHYGIRHESLELVVESAHKGFYQFETLTKVHFDITAIDFNLLTPDEKNWLHHYHHNVLKSVLGRLTPEVQTWMEAYISIKT